MTDRPSIDIVIVSYNARDDLRDCLASLRAHPPHRPWTVTVVDNASSDGSPVVARETLPDARVIALDGNVGFARANNIGIRTGNGALLLLLNSDTVVADGAIDRLADVLAADPLAAAAGARLVGPSGRAELSFGRMLSPWNELRQKAVVRLQERGVRWAVRLVERRTRRAQVVDWVSGACLLVWRREAEAVGLLDERYFMYAEDVDFCAALRGRGRRVLFTPEAQIVHRRGGSRRGAPAATAVAYRRSQIAFYAKHHPRWSRLLELYLRAKGAWPR
jgi:GT2 family glycosyltransferase